MHELFDAYGVLVGWIGYRSTVGREVFVPRRNEDIESDHRAIAARMRPAKPTDAFGGDTRRTPAEPLLGWRRTRKRAA
jgi:hypothetical protein